MNRRFVNAVIVLLLVAVAGCASSTEREADKEKKNNRAETHVMLGANYLQRGQLDVAKEELDKALKEAPDNSQANNIMAVLQWRLKKYDEADRFFRKALDTDPGNSSAHHNYGAFLCDRGKLRFVGDGIGQDVDRAGDGSEHVVEVMRDTAGQLTDRFHLLRLPQLLLGCELFGEILDKAIEHIAVVPS